MKPSDSHILDYLDEHLDQSGCDALESRLERDATTSNAIEDARLAMHALHELAREEPVVVSADFWPRLREQLPDLPPRNPLSKIVSSAATLLWPTSSKWALSARVALLAAILAMASLWLGPQRTITHSSAFSPAEKDFISRSLQRHEDYISTPPAVNTLPMPIGDAASSEPVTSTADDDYIP